MLVLWEKSQKCFKGIFCIFTASVDELGTDSRFIGIFFSSFRLFSYLLIWEEKQIDLLLLGRQVRVFSTLEMFNRFNRNIE